MKFFISTGVDVNKGSNTGETALHMATVNRHIDVVRYLLNLPQIDKDRVDKQGRTAQFVAATTKNTALMNYFGDGTRPLQGTKDTFSLIYREVR